jgi:shikimate dehydrogenase
MKTYGLIGYPLGHSFSKKYFTEKFEKENIKDNIYNLYPIENIHLFPKLINDNSNLLGLNVTIPYKESIITFLDELDATAKGIGAVNCIKILNDEKKIKGVIKNKKLIGYNTDAFGFRQSIKPFLEKQHEKALILGTGGASKAVAYVLREIGVNCFFVSRTKSETSKNQFIYNELNENIINTFKLIVNSSPVGTYPNIEEAPPIPYQYISSEHLLYDLVYNPEQTEFLKRGKEKGATTVNGLSMLQQQAEEAWRIWNSNI